MTVFDIDAQRDAARKNLSESTFAYLNRSSAERSEANRGLIEDWFSHLPKSEQHEFRSRFRSRNNVQFETSFQELFLHEFLRRQKCKLDFHPDLAGTTRRPDFLVRQPQDGTFILEACTSTVSWSGQERNLRGDRIREFLRSLQVDEYKLGINELTVGKTDLAQRPLRKHIEDAIHGNIAAPKGKVMIPPFSTPDGWRIRLTAWLTAGYGSMHSTTIIYEACGKTWDGPSYPLRDALKKKSSRYGNPLDMPYVVALNSSDVMVTDRDLEETLFGVRPGTTIAGMTDDLSRGFWGNESAPNHRHVSAVLLLPTYGRKPRRCAKFAFVYISILGPIALMKDCLRSCQASDSKTVRCGSSGASPGTN